MSYSPEQIQRYLARIGAEGTLPHCADTLTKIISAHYRAVPYENLDILAGLSSWIRRPCSKKSWRSSGGDSGSN